MANLSDIKYLNPVDIGNISAETDENTLPRVCSGTYTPTFDGLSPHTLVADGQGQWMRVGNLVTVAGRFTLDVDNSSISANFRMRVPIGTSQFLGNEKAAGLAIAAGTAKMNVAKIQGHVPTSRAEVSIFFNYGGTEFPSGTNTSETYQYHFSYTIP